MTVFKVIEKGITVGILPGPPTIWQQDDDDFMNKYNKNEKPETVMPDKLFIIRTEKMRPYKRLDHKFQTLFDKAILKQQAHRELELMNFAKTTRMVIQLSNEVQVVKDVIDAV